MFKSAFAFLALLFATAGAAAPAPSSLRLVDLTGAFDRFAMATQGMDDAARVAAFEKQMGPLGDGFYSRARKPENYDKRVAGHLRNYPQLREGILGVSKRFDTMFETARGGFEARFGKLRAAEPIYLVDSMGEMDGGTRDINGKHILFFGADVISKIHNDKDMRPFFQHELFHLYHEPSMQGCDAIWCSMWEEGLATYVASRLNPEAGDAALMLDIPAPIRPAVDADPQAAFCAARPLLTSEDEKKYATLFYGNAHLPNYPARMGYYLGYLLVGDLGRTRSLRQLASLKGAELKKAFDAAYDRRAGTCPPA